MQLLKVSQIPMCIPLKYRDTFFNGKEISCTVYTQRLVEDFVSVGINWGILYCVFENPVFKKNVTLFTCGCDKPINGHNKLKVIHNSSSIRVVVPHKLLNLVSKIDSFEAMQGITKYRREG